MKEVVYRNICGNNPKKHEVSIEEISDQSDSRVAKKWITKYFIKDSYSSDVMAELKAWVAVQKRRAASKDCHILRNYDKRTGENKIICKVLGDFYIIQGNAAYRIVYVNEIKIQILGGLKRDKGFINKRY
ncbi:MAG: hypothetical protein WBD00_07665 [Candidatus Omnitrophota bacterium]